MLLPHEWGVITVGEARLLRDFIEKATAPKNVSKDYKKIGEAGLSEIHQKLDELVNLHDHYEGELRYLNTSDFQKAE